MLSIGEKKSRSSEESPRASGKNKRQPSPHPSASKRAKLAQLNELATPSSGVTIQPSSAENKSSSGATELADSTQENAGPRKSSSSKLSDGWIGHPLDPINSLFDCLLAASEGVGQKRGKNPDESNHRQKAAWIFASESSNISYLTISTGSTSDRYLILAVEASLIGKWIPVIIQDKKCWARGGEIDTWLNRFFSVGTAKKIAQLSLHQAESQKAGRNANKKVRGVGRGSQADTSNKGAGATPAGRLFMECAGQGSFSRQYAYAHLRHIPLPNSVASWRRSSL